MLVRIVVPIDAFGIGHLPIVEQRITGLNKSDIGIAVIDRT